MSTENEQEIEIIVDEAPAAPPADADPTPEAKAEGGSAPQASADTAPSAPANEQDPLAATQRHLREKQAEVDRERQARLAAEEAARRAEGKAEHVQAVSIEAQIQAGLDANALAVEAAKQALAKAYEEGNYTEVAERTAEISELKTKKVNMEAGLARIRNGRQQPQPQQPQSQPARPQQPLTPEQQVEQYARTLPAKAAAWVRAHPDCVTDPRFNKLVAAAALEAEADGHQIETDAYFDYIERKVGLRQDDASGRVAQPAPRPAPRVAAPVSRDVPGASPGAGGRQIARLTKEEAEMADLQGISYADYWKNKQALIKEGKIGAAR